MDKISIIGAKEHNLKDVDLEIPKIKNLDTNTVRCECTRSTFREDPLYNKSYHEVGLKFEQPNTEYLKQLYELAIAKKI